MGPEILTFLKFLKFHVSFVSRSLAWEVTSYSSDSDCCRVQETVY